jgi:hypothetical protein
VLPLAGWTRQVQRKRYRAWARLDQNEVSGLKTCGSNVGEVKILLIGNSSLGDGLAVHHFFADATMLCIPYTYYANGMDTSVQACILRAPWC